MTTHPYPPPLPEFDAQSFRQRLAGLADNRAAVNSIERADLRELAVTFVATLPTLFGEQLDRLTLWDKIGSSLESAYAKTVNGDCDYFVNNVLHSLQTSPSQASRSESLSQVLATLQSYTEEMRCQWLGYLHTHRFPVLVRAKADWEQQKLNRLAGE